MSHQITHWEEDSEGWKRRVRNPRTLYELSKMCIHHHTTWNGQNYLPLPTVLKEDVKNTYIDHILHCSEEIVPLEEDEIPTQFSEPWEYCGPDVRATIDKWPYGVPNYFGFEWNILEYIWYDIYFYYGEIQERKERHCHTCYLRNMKEDLNMQSYTITSKGEVSSVTTTPHCKVVMKMCTQTACYGTDIIDHIQCHDWWCSNCKVRNIGYIYGDTGKRANALIRVIERTSYVYDGSRWRTHCRAS